MKIHKDYFLISDSEWNYLLVHPLNSTWIWETFFINEYHKLQLEKSFENDYSDFYFELAKRTWTMIEFINQDRFIDLNIC